MAPDYETPDPDNCNYEEFDAAMAAATQEQYDAAYVDLINCPCQWTGPEEIVEMVERAAQAAGFRTRRVPVVRAGGESVPLPADTIEQPPKLSDMTVGQALRAIRSALARWLFAASWRLM